MFEDYSSSEVAWETMNYNFSLKDKENMAWTVISNSDEIKPFKAKVLSSDNLKEIEKSEYSYIVTLQRNPTSPVMYLIVPTVIISIFNNLAYLVPGNGGLTIFELLILLFLFYKIYKSY